VSVRFGYFCYELRWVGPNTGFGGTMSGSDKLEDLAHFFEHLQSFL
jgi:hypothetical protein